VSYHLSSNPLFKSHRYAANELLEELDERLELELELERLEDELLELDELDRLEEDEDDEEHRINTLWVPPEVPGPSVLR